MIKYKKINWKFLIQCLVFSMTLTFALPAFSILTLFDLLSNASTGVNWTVSNTSRALINSLDELNLRNGYVEAESQTFDFSNASSIDLSFDVYVPFNLLGLIGSAPSPGEDLRVDYRRSDGSWQTLTTFVADNGLLGILSLGGALNYSTSLPVDAYHEDFQVRYVMLGGGQNLFDFLGDNWYVSNIEITADLPPAAPDHYRFSYASAALTCAPHSVSVSACADASCSTLYADPVSVTLTPSGWIGGNTRAFTGATTAELSVTSAVTVSVGVSASAPAAIGGSNLCSIDGGAYSTDCTLSFADAGLLVDVPDYLSARGTTAATIQAVRKSDNAAECVPAFANVSKNVSLWTGYDIPSSGTLATTLNGSPLSSSSGSPTIVALNFDGTGQATLPELNYADAGQKTLYARYNGSGSDAGLLLEGGDAYIARPIGLCVDTGAFCGAADASCDVFTKAGSPFPVTVTAVAWESDGDTDFCDGNVGTANYNSGGAVSLTSSILAPAGGVNGVITPANYTHTANAGGANTFNMTESEVGVFTFSATPPLYMGAALGSLSSTTSVTYNSQPTGRFIPDHFEASMANQGELAPTCPTENTYTGEAMTWLVAPAITLTAYNAATPTKAITQNYTHNDFRKLTAAAINSNLTTPTSDAMTQGTDAVLLPLTGAPDTEFLDGSLTVTAPGEMQYVFSAVDRITYQRTSAAEVNPFNPSLEFTLGTAVTDGEADILGDISFTPDGTGVDMRYGRMRGYSTYGPENADLIMPLRAEYFQDGEYLINTLDSCTTWDSANAAIDSRSVIQASSGTLSSGTSGSDGIILLAPTMVPGLPDTGDASVSYDVPPWLEWDYNGDGLYEDPPPTIITFGIYRGHERVIYRKELR